MAVRPQHMHDGSILERRLRPIYDWLDNGNNKKALQEAEKVLKKSHRLQSARALKALALFRLGRAAEAQALLDALAEEKPSDENTLQAMTISYRESQQLHKVCSLYETAIKTEPTSEELHSHLFMSYVRVGDYLSQQRAAMALYKLTPKNPYYFWAVMSIVLQAKSTNETTKRGILLTLAQRMIDNFISDNKMEAEQEARLYIMILELQEKWEDILKFIEGPLYNKLVPGSAPQSFIPYLKKLGHWRRLNIVCKELLWENQDRWDYYLPYFDSVFELMKIKEPDAEGSVDDTAEKAHEFICQLVESMSSGKTLRGPYLARLELWKRLNEDPSSPDPTTLLGSGIALCMQYLRVFAHKPCAVPDLRQYLAMLPKKEREEHSREFLTCLGFDENSEPETSDDIQRHISCLCAWRLTAPPLEACACATLARTLRRHYLRCAQQGLITATITEFCSPDSYALLAAHHYFYLAAQQQSSAPVVEALALLEQALENSPANFHIKLLLVKLYHVLGDGESAESAFARVEVKHVQLVSLGWLHTARLAAVGAPAAALQRLADTRSFHTHHAKDSVEHLTYAYKYGTFEKLCEVMSWNSRLERCAWCALAARDRALLSLLAGPPAPLHAPRPAPANPTDNRDLEVIVGWEPAQCQDPELKARTFEQDVAYLRLKDGLVSSIALCIELSDSRPLNEKRQQYEELKTCVQAFNDAMDKCKDKYSVKEKIGITGPFPSRIIAWVRSEVGYRELYVGALSVVAELAVGGAELRPSGEQLAAALRTAAASLGAAVRPHAHSDPQWTARTRMEDITNYLEFIGIITYLLGVCNEIVTPANAKRNKKKAHQSADDAKTVEMLNKLNEAVQDSIATLKDILDEWPRASTETIDNTIEEEFTNLNIDKYKSLVIDKLKEGQNKTNLKDILNKKLKYLKTLIQ